MTTDRVQSARRMGRKAQSAAGTFASDIPGHIEQLRDTASETADRIQETYEQAMDQTRATAQSVRQRVKRQPLAAVLAAGVIGYTLAWLLHRRW